MWLKSPGCNGKPATREKEIHEPRRRWSLRTLLSLNLIAFALVTALLVLFWMYRSNIQTIHALSEKMIEDAATHMVVQTEEHIEDVHRVLDAILLSQPSEQQAQAAKAMLNNPIEFETLAFGLTRMSRDMTFVLMAHPSGEFINVRRSPSKLASEMVVHQHLPQADNDSFFCAVARGP